jgi:hypothetical protein
MIISRPGVYFGIEARDYHADPAPEPSFSQSLGKILLANSPRHAWLAHPRLNPNWRPNSDEGYEKDRIIGVAAHAYTIGRDKSVVVMPHTNFRTKEAQELRDRTFDEARTPILPHHDELARLMAEAVHRQLLGHEAHNAFVTDTGHGEVVLVWQEDSLWMRCMLDWVHNDYRTVDDLKTGGRSSSEHALPPRISDDGWDMQAAMAERGLDVLDPENAGRRRFRFFPQENFEPFGLNVVELTEADMTMGRKKLQMAIDIWRHCMATNSWPLYPKRVLRLTRPEYQDRKWLEREIDAEEQRKLDDLSRRKDEGEPLDRMARAVNNLMAGSS